jgi:DnaJ-class molecular chaperone
MTRDWHTTTPEAAAEWERRRALDDGGDRLDEPDPEFEGQECSECDGRGEIEEGTGYASDEGGEASRAVVCPACGGSGRRDAGDDCGCGDSCCPCGGRKRGAP